MKRKRDPMAREILDRKGPFAPKVINPKKQEYRRIKLDPRNLDEEESENEMTRVFNDDYDRKMEKFLEGWLENMTFDEFLEKLGYTTSDVFLHLLYSGFIDDEELEEFKTSEG